MFLFFFVIVITMLDLVSTIGFGIASSFVATLTQTAGIL